MPGYRLCGFGGQVNSRRKGLIGSVHLVAHRTVSESDTRLQAISGKLPDESSPMRR